MQEYFPGIDRIKYEGPKEGAPAEAEAVLHEVTRRDGTH